MVGNKFCVCLNFFLIFMDAWILYSVAIITVHHFYCFEVLFVLAWFEVFGLLVGFCCCCCCFLGGIEQPRQSLSF